MLYASSAFYFHMIFRRIYIICVTHRRSLPRKLQGSEQEKVKMCLLTLVPCNFLIMDEPINHLDIQAKESLKTALMDFRGTVLLVSHEESFCKDWAHRVINIENLSYSFLNAKKQFIVLISCVFVISDGSIIISNLPYILCWP